MENQSTHKKGKSIIDTLYRSGHFLEKSSGHLDAIFKVSHLETFLQQNPDLLPVPVRKIADVGCGVGTTTNILGDVFNRNTELSIQIDGYDVHPKVEELSAGNNVNFIPGDFCMVSRSVYDLAVLFDVVEHVPNPIGFLKGVAKFADRIALIIPLDDAIFSWLRNLPKIKLSHPGHLLVLDAPAALNMLAFSGLRVMDYSFIPVFRAPSGRETRGQRLLNPIREILYRISPVLLQKTLGGVSLLVLAVSPRIFAES